MTIGLDQLREGVDIPLPTATGRWTLRVTVRLPGLPPVELAELTIELA